MSRDKLQLQLGRSRAASISISMIAIILAFGPSVLGNYHQFVATQTFIWMMAALGVNLLLGNAGLLSLGQGAFVAMGAYGTGVLVATHGLPFPLAIVLSLLFTVFIGILLGFPAIKIHGMYLAMVTLAYAGLVILVIENWESVTGGVNGLSIRADPWLVDPSSQVVLYHLTWVSAIVLAVLLRQFLRSPLGRSIQAVRDSETAAAAFGISVVRCKLVAFGISAGFASIAGSFYALNVGYLTSLEFNAFLSVELLIAVTIGGLGSVVGSALGATIVFAGPELLRFMHDLHDLVLGSMMLIVVMFARKGLAGVPRLIQVFMSSRDTGVTGVTRSEEG